MIRHFSSKKRAIRQAFDKIDHPLFSSDIGKDHGVKNKFKGDAHIKSLPKQKIEKIGEKSLLDKKWAEQPADVLGSPNKLTEIELCKTLQKIVELPEKRLESLELKEVFLKNLTQRLPMFLTSSLVTLAEIATKE
jgi:hypothetical protein